MASKKELLEAADMVESEAKNYANDTSKLLLNIVSYFRMMAEISTFEHNDKYYISEAALNVVKNASTLNFEQLLSEATSIKNEADNGYYDDNNGCNLLIQISEYFRLKALTRLK